MQEGCGIRVAVGRTCGDLALPGWGAQHCCISPLLNQRANITGRSGRYTRFWLGLACELDDTHLLQSCPPQHLPSLGLHSRASTCGFLSSTRIPHLARLLQLETAGGAHGTPRRRLGRVALRSRVRRTSSDDSDETVVRLHPRLPGSRVCDRVVSVVSSW